MLRLRYLVILVIGFYLRAFGECSLADQPDYMPIETGNWWVFEKFDVHGITAGSMGTFSVQVVATTTISDTTYFVITQDWRELIPDTVYVRKEGAKVFWRMKDQDQLVYDFAAPQGSSWEFFLPSMEETVSLPVRVRANALSEDGLDDGIGTDPYRRYFGFEPPGIEGAWYEVYLAGVGPVFIKWYPTETELWDIGRLKEAHVGGKVIPGTEVTSLPTMTLGQLKKHIQTRR